MRYKFFKILSLIAVLISSLFILSTNISAFSSDQATGGAGNYASREENEYNFLPLVLEPGLKKVGGPGPKDQVISNMVFDQGYEVQCAKKSWNITPAVYGAIEEYFASGHSGTTLAGDATFHTDLENTTIPLFRGDEAFTETKKNSSFEGFFGANKPDTTQNTPENAGVANLLLSQAGQCIAKYGNLISLFGDGGLCDKLENKDECFLNYEIDGADGLTTEELYQEMSSLFSKSNSDDETFSCLHLAQGYSENVKAFGVSQKKYKEISTAVQFLPLNIDRLYRLAYLVISPEQSPPDEGIFGFLQEGPTEDDQHAPLFVSFKVPYVATNTIFSLPYLRDASALTAYSLNSREELKRNESEIKSERNEFIENIKSVIDGKIPAEDLVINCKDMPQCTGDNDKKVMQQALVDIINGSQENCQNFKGPYEQAGELGSPASTSVDKKYRKPFFSETLNNKAENSFRWSLKIEDKNVKSAAKNEKLPITAHIVAPYGSDMEYLANSMQIFFGYKQFKKLVENNCIADFNGECGIIPEFLTLGGAISELESKSDSYKFNTDIGCDKLPKEEQEDCEKKSIGANSAENPNEALIIMGGKIGWMIQKMQESLWEANNKVRTYLESCERAEDLFLGRCEGYLGNPGGDDSSETAADSCDDFRSVTVDLPTMPELEDLVCDVAAGDANIAGQDIYDAQLVWGMMQVDGSPFLRRIVQDGASEMSCGDLLINSCGASQIVGILVPHCIDKDACPQAAYIADDEKLRKEITPEIACSVKGSLEYILQKRKSETSYLKETYRAAKGKEPTEKQLYYMYAARNYGLPPEIFVEDACKGAPEVQGCAGKNYCECVMDVFSYSCI